MPMRKATAIWEGAPREGKGTLRVESGMCECPYSFASRFEEAKGTNPEEILGAAHAGCFSQALAIELTRKGTPPRRIETTSEVLLERVGVGFKITSITLRTQADVPGASEQAFLEASEEAKVNCPISQALAAVKISLEARLRKSE